MGPDYGYGNQTHKLHPLSHLETDGERWAHFLGLYVKLGLFRDPSNESHQLVRKKKKNRRFFFLFFFSQADVTRIN